MNNSWVDLSDALLKFKKNNLSPVFWIRDDDSIKDGPKLRKMINIVCKHKTPLSLAVIPYKIEKSLIDYLYKNNLISILQHGYKHINHAEENDKKTEFGSSREINHMIKDIQQGQNLIRNSFLFQYEPVFVPPWNRMTNLLFPYFEEIGIKCVSKINNDITKDFNNICNSTPMIINTNVDIINWKNKKTFLGEEEVIKKIIFDLQIRRERKVKNTPIGILTHHAVMENDSFVFLEKLISETIKYGGLWNSIKQIMNQL